MDIITHIIVFNVWKPFVQLTSQSYFPNEVKETKNICMTLNIYVEILEIVKGNDFKKGKNTTIQR